MKFNLKHYIIKFFKNLIYINFILEIYINNITIYDI